MTEPWYAEAEARLDAIEGVLARHDPKFKPLTPEGRDHLIRDVHEAVQRPMPLQTARVLARIFFGDET